jgi:hypothetical protein
MKRFNKVYHDLANWLKDNNRLARTVVRIHATFEGYQTFQVGISVSYQAMAANINILPLERLEIWKDVLRTGATVVSQTVASP